jgi:energy-converting hydrogenase Eha subunit A
MFDQIQLYVSDIIIVALIATAVSVVLGLVLSLFYMRIKREQGYTHDFPWTLVIIPPVVSMLIIMLSANLAGGIAVGGLFALTRFRTQQKETEDIAFVLLTVVIGVINGTGYIAYSVVFTLIMMIILFVMYIVKFGQTSDRNMVLKIIVPESLNYENLFDDLLKEGCLSYQINRVRTTDFGTMFELTFYVVLKKTTSQKNLIDQIRTRNGNMTVSLTVQRFNSD